MIDAGGTLRTLFHPFEKGLLAPPAAGRRILFLGARAGLRLPPDFDSSVAVVQGFRPDFLALRQAGFEVMPRADGESYDAVLVLSTRHRGENEINIAVALERVIDGGLIFVAGSRDDGIASLATRIAALTPVDGKVPKHHGLAFWFHAPPDRADIAAGLRRSNARTPVDGRFETAPGMFSSDRSDPGSRLLANALPRDVAGDVADFCAGWGYLSAELVSHCPRIRSLDLYEADHASLEAARRNLSRHDMPTMRFFWLDLLEEPVTARYDVIVMNPPFHRVRAAEPDIGVRLVARAAAALRAKGRLFVVGNRGLPYEKAMATSLAEVSELVRDDTYRVWVGRR